MWLSRHTLLILTCKYSWCGEQIGTLRILVSTGTGIINGHPRDVCGELGKKVSLL